MKKRTGNTHMPLGLAAALALSLSAAMLGGCGSKDAKTETTAAASAQASDAQGKDAEDSERDLADILGSWDDDEDQLSLCFFDDGTVLLSDMYEVYESEYEWDGAMVQIVDPISGDTMTALMVDVDGEDCLDFGDDYDGYYYRVDEMFYLPPDGDAPEAPEDSDDTGIEPVEISGTAWEVEGNTYSFYSDGILYVDSGIYGTYSWDGLDGRLSVDDLPVPIEAGDGCLWIEGEHGTAYRMEYAGDAEEGIAAALDILGDWNSVQTDDTITFDTDGEVSFRINGAYGGGTFDFDGTDVEFAGYTGYIDEEGDLVIDGIDGWFEHDI